MNFNNPKYQVYVLVTISVIVSLSFNVIRSNPISMIAQDLKKINNKNILPPLYGALLKNEADVELFEKIAFMSRREN